MPVRLQEDPGGALHGSPSAGERGGRGLPLLASRPIWPAFFDRNRGKTAGQRIAARSRRILRRSAHSTILPMTS